MRKVEDNVIEITEEVKIGNGLILEKGDKIQVVNEDSHGVDISSAVAKLQREIYTKVEPFDISYERGDDSIELSFPRDVDEDEIENWVDNWMARVLPRGTSTQYDCFMTGSPEVIEVTVSLF